MDPIRVLLGVLKTRDPMEMSRYDPTRQVGLFSSDTLNVLFIATEVFRVADDSTGHLATYMFNDPVTGRSCDIYFVGS